MYKNTILIIVITLIVLSSTIDTNKLKLKQVLIFSRHNIRTGLYNMDKYSLKKWPKSDQPSGQLTAKGSLLEGYMGEYFKKWFKSEQFFDNECPTDGTVYVYSNSANRTIATAEAFFKSAFTDCNIPVYHKHEREGKIDPVFAAVIHNSTTEFKEKLLNDMKKEMQNEKYKQPLLELNEILNVRESEICREQSICDLSDLTKNNIGVKVGEKVTVSGPLYIAVKAMDGFIVNFYNGRPIEDVAWGLIDTAEKWRRLTDLCLLNQHMRFTLPAKDVGRPMNDYITKIFQDYDNKQKLIFISGHDFNVNTILSSFEVKPFHPLPNQYEPYPIGSKIVFQRWTDNKTDYVKIEYVYATWTQIRDGAKLSLENPPQRVLLHLSWCSMDEDGFCLWEEFKSKLYSVVTDSLL